MNARFALVRAALGTMSIVALLVSMARAGGDDKVDFIDLTSKMNRKLTDDLGSGGSGNSLSSLPTGQQILGDVKFDVGPGLIQLGSKVFDGFPEKVEGIPVDRQVGKLHFLHATCYGGGPNDEGSEWHVKDGTLIGQYVVQFEDGSSEGIPIVYGEDVRDWWYLDGEKEPNKGKVVWKGDNDYATEIGAHLRLYVSSWTNPKPNKKVARIDYVSQKAVTPAAPFCLAITVERK